MKRKVLLFLVLATLVAGGAFAQKVGDNVDVFGKKYTVKEVKDGNVLLEPALTLDGTWKVSDDFVVKINGNNSTFITFNPPTGIRERSAVDKGFIKIGNTPYYKNIVKKGDRTWSAQYITILWNTNAPTVATGLNYVPCTLTLSADGKTLTDDKGSSFTRQ